MIHLTDFMTIGNNPRRDAFHRVPDIPSGRPTNVRDGVESVLTRFMTSAFTLIELLVVIAIIGVLASLTVGLSSVASRKSKESRVRGELDKLATAIDNYKAALGTYPPDNPGKPWLNQLFYELSGTIYTNKGGRGYFRHWMAGN